MSNSIKSVVLTLVLLSLIAWFFNRAISFAALYVYRHTGAYLFRSTDFVQNVSLGYRNFFYSQERIAKLEKDLYNLKLSNIKLSADAAKLNAYESSELYESNVPENTIKAKIIGRSPDNWHEQLIIDRGLNAGIKQGQGVMTINGIIGQIAMVSADSSIVKLINSKDFQMGVKLASNNEYGILKGDFPNPPALDFININSKVKLNDRIVSSGVCMNDTCPYPADYPIGFVKSVSKNPNIVDLVIKVKPAEDLKRLKEVFVLKHGK
jgi:rod shape-determining protein MreC